MRTGISITLRPADRRRLKALARDRNAPHKHVWRAEIVLFSADGVGTNEIMRRTGKSKTCVWRAEKAAAEKATEELGSAWGLIEMGEVLTFDHLNKELEISERLSRQKERLLKQLMFARGVKSLSLSASASASPPLITTHA